MQALLLKGNTTSHWFRSAWSRLFELQGAPLMEVLLFVLLANAVGDGLAAATESRDHFHDADAFDSVTIAINRIGFASPLPEDVVLSYNFSRLVGAAAAISGILWLFKRGLPITPLICAIAHGMHVSLDESRMHNYKHQELPAVAVLFVYAAFYWFHHPSIRRALADHTFWRELIYPAWVPALIIAYLGLHYTYSGLTKVAISGADVGNGLTMQLLLSTRQFPDGTYPWLARPLMECRPLASIAHFSAVVLEVGAFPAFCSRYLRPFWALGLFLFHLVVIQTLAIPFKVHMAILAWMVVWGIRDYLVAHNYTWALRSPWQIPLNAHGWASHLLRPLYGIDVWQVFRFPTIERRQPLRVV